MKDEKIQDKKRITFPLRKDLRTQLCPVCDTSMGDMPGSRDAYCPNCGFKDPCCE